MRILLAEDEAQMSRVLTTALAHEGHRVDAVYDGQAAVDKAREHAYDVIILDIMMPKKTGIQALQEIRASGNESHVIMLTAMAEVDDRVTGLDAGADDYLTKPFSLKELLARLRAMERRKDSMTRTELSIANVQLNTNEQEILAENSMRLSSKETRLLAFFFQNPDKELSTEEIFRYVWRDEADKTADRSYVYVYISYLRQKLQAIQAKVAIIGEEGGDFRLQVQE